MRSSSSAFCRASRSFSSARSFLMRSSCRSSSSVSSSSESSSESEAAAPFPPPAPASPSALLRSSASLSLSSSSSSSSLSSWAGQQSPDKHPSCPVSSPLARPARAARRVRTNFVRDQLEALRFVHAGLCGGRHTRQCSARSVSALVRSLASPPGGRARTAAAALLLLGALLGGLLLLRKELLAQLAARLFVGAALRRRLPVASTMRRRRAPVGRVSATRLVPRTASATPRTGT